LQRGVERLSEAERERVVEALTADPELACAWSLKEGLRAVYKKRRHEEAAAALDKWIVDARASGLRPFQRAGTTLQKWRREVLNYWRYPITNAPPEAGQAQSHQDAEQQDLRLPERQELSAKDRGC
jgi:transposase